MVRADRAPASSQCNVHHLTRSSPRTAGYSALAQRLPKSINPPTLDIDPPLLRTYLQSLRVKVGLGLLLVGAGPLVFIIGAAALGLWPDPNPNPIGPGLLFFFTFWPAIICIVIGVIRVRIRNRRAS